MRCASRTRKWWVGLVSVALGLGVALPAGAADEDEGAAATISIFEIPDVNDRVMIIENGGPPVKVRVRTPGIRIYEDLDPVGHWPDPNAIPTRGLEARAVDTIYHATRDYGQPSGIVIRAVGTVAQDNIRIHRASDPVNGSRIRYHGGFR